MAPSNSYLSGQHSMMTMMDGGNMMGSSHGGVLPSMPAVSMHLHMTQHHHHHWPSSTGSSVTSSGGSSIGGQVAMDGRQHQDDDSGGELPLFFIMLGWFTSLRRGRLLV